MKFEVRKPFTWNGKNCETGDIIEIPDDNERIGAMSRAKFIRVAPVVNPAVAAAKEVVKKAKSGSDRKSV